MERYLILSVAFFAIWGGHWMPWRVIPFLVDERGDHPRASLQVAVGVITPDSWIYAVAR